MSGLKLVEQDFLRGGNALGKSGYFHAPSGFFAAASGSEPLASFIR